MKAVFVGGGSFRTLPIVRGALQTPGLLDGGEIALVDFNRPRIEAVAALIRKCPEYAAAAPRVTLHARTERALPGAGIVHVSFPCGSFRAAGLMDAASLKAGFLPSDMLSVAGAFRAAAGGPRVLDIARAVEKHAPDAWIVDFANPVAVYSALVNNHTRVRALGVCGGFLNHRWDLTRLLENRDAPEDVYRLSVAGVNHLAFILRGTHRGTDLYPKLDRLIRDPKWKPCRLPGVKPRPREAYVRRQLADMLELRRRFGVTVFSTEGDGMMHLFWEDRLRRARAEARPVSAARLAREEKAAADARARRDAWYRQEAARNELPAGFWAGAPWTNPYFAADPGNAGVVAMRGLGGRRGGKREWLAASFPNRGAVRGFKDRTVLEYSMTVGPDGPRPEADLEVPDAFHGLVSALATHQTMLADAIAARDPKLFAAALSAYPMGGESGAAKKLFRAGARIFADEMPREFGRLGDFL